MFFKFLFVHNISYNYINIITLNNLVYLTNYFLTKICAIITLYYVKVIKIITEDYERQETDKTQTNSLDIDQDGKNSTRSNNNSEEDEFLGAPCKQKIQKNTLWELFHKLNIEDTNTEGKRSAKLGDINNKLLNKDTKHKNDLKDKNGKNRFIDTISMLQKEIEIEK